MEQCATFNASTGFEEIEFFRRETQVAATSIIATTVVIWQIWLLLLFLPLAQLPKFMRKLDVELNFEEIFSKKKNTSTQSESETDSLIADEKEQSKRRKRASGGVATMIIIVILIIVSTTSFVVTSESPGTVSYQTNQLSSDENLLDRSSTAFGIIFDFVMAGGRIINGYLVYSQSTLITNELGSEWRYNQTCELARITIKNKYGRAPFALDLGMFSNVSPYRARMTQTYATVCRLLTSSSDKSFSLNAYTPVAPVLSNYPPPGIFTDGPAVIKNREVATSTTVPVVSLTWTWTEMVSTSILDLLAPLSMSRTLQAKVESELSTRGINSTFTFYNPDGTTIELPWPSCDKLPSGYVPVLSFVMSYQPESPNNMSYVVSERSFLSWAFATLITLGSVIALKPTITNYLDKLSTYWRMKLWARWTLFVLYTLLMPLPMLFVLLKYITDQKRFIVRGADHYYNIRMFVLLIVMAGLLMLTWVGVLARHIYMTRQERMKRREKEEQSNGIIVEPENASYEQIM